MIWYGQYSYKVAAYFIISLTFLYQILEFYGNNFQKFVSQKLSCILCCSLCCLCKIIGSIYRVTCMQHIYLVQYMLYPIVCHKLVFCWNGWMDEVVFDTGYPQLIPYCVSTPQNPRNWHVINWCIGGHIIVIRYLDISRNKGTARFNVIPNSELS